MRETIQIQYGDILRIYQVEEMADLGMRKVYRVYYSNTWDFTLKSLFICFAKDLNDVRTQFQAVVNERLKTKEQLDEYIKRCAQLQAQLDRKEAKFKEYFSFLLNDADWVHIDRIKLTNNDHLYRATRLNTGETYYEITRKTGREQLKVLFKKVIEDDIKERKSHAKWKHVCEVETRKEGLKIVYEFFYLTLSNDRAVYKITEIKTENEHTKVDDFMVWEDELLTEDRILRYMDNMKDNYLTLTKQMENLREMLTTKNMVNYELEKSLDDARELQEKNKALNEVTEALSKELKNAHKRLEEQKEQIEELEAENDALNVVTEAQIEEIKKLQELIKRIKLKLKSPANQIKHCLEEVENLERQKQHLKVVLRAEAVNRGMVQIKDFEEYVEKVLDDFL